MLSYDTVRMLAQQHVDQRREEGSRERLAHELRPVHRSLMPLRWRPRIHVPSLARRHGAATGA